MIFRPERIVILLLLLTIFMPCKAEETKLLILSGVPPHAWLAGKITGDIAESTAIVNSGVDPHTFEPTKKQVADIYKADLIINSGLPFEQRLIEKLSREKQNLVLNVADDHYGHHHHDSHCDIQHSWLSPVALLKQTELITARLIKSYPEKAESFRINAGALSEEIASTQSAVSNKLARISSRKVYIFHPALEAFSSEFNLEQIAIEHEGKSPSPRRLRKIISDARKENIKVIFTHPQFDKKGAEAVSSATGAKLVEFDPLEYNPLTNILRLAEIISEQNK